MDKDSFNEDNTFYHEEEDHTEIEIIKCIL